MLFKVIFADGTEFEGGPSIFDSKWTSIPDKEIAEVHYFLPDKNRLVLSGYEAYNHLVEATTDIYGPKGVKLGTKIHNVYIMGLKGRIVTSYRISLRDTIDSRYKVGDITRREYTKGYEFRGLSTINWKKGINKE